MSKAPVEPVRRFLPLMAVVLVLFAVAALWPLVGNSAARNAGAAGQIAVNLVPFAIFFAAVAAAARAEGRTFAAAVGISRRHLGLQLLIALGLLVVSLALTLALAAVGFRMFGEGQPQLVMFLYAAVRNFILVGFGEELIWRGYVLGSLRRALHSDTAAILLSSALFGLWHYPGGQDVLQVVMTTFFGALWGTARVRIRHCSTLATGTAHGLHDLSLLILATYAA
ncbi:membrane protease YdiL (CAAX protease family) [Arthrobacter ulcerisalmonis]|uniref:CPBP family intramembrane glutamic endopeptidase n=1 Tax=Arthrobacter sp. B1I2 TaxID=3042263 RepID=UPI0027890BE6|nr:MULTISPECIES: CPBP family intramembrane glutamic endopeptidase [Arthrobacter]MDQ0663553.1 membrane protease YdiL (CAAX protease family) [Arthrobacter ulcerisalmonis]MDQ0731436.1 membrane protease YdiL (CAAX protease family) [Arthrobacter sp. B1I2]